MITLVDELSKTQLKFSMDMTHPKGIMQVSVDGKTYFLTAKGWSYITKVLSGKIIMDYCKSRNISLVIRNSCMNKITLHMVTKK